MVQWLWSKLLQQDLDQWKQNQNDHTVRRDNNKFLPSGVSPNVAFSLHHKYGAENYLQPVDVAVVQSLMEKIGGEALIQFVSIEYAVQAQSVYDNLHIGSLTFDNVWYIFQSMLPQM